LILFKQALRERAAYCTCLGTRVDVRESHTQLAFRVAAIWK